MNLSPNEIIQLLARGSSLRIPAKGQTLEHMKEYAKTASVGGTKIEFVVSPTDEISSEVMLDVALAGPRTVTWDFVALTASRA